MEDYRSNTPPPPPKTYNLRFPLSPDALRYHIIGFWLHESMDIHESMTMQLRD